MAPLTTAVLISPIPIFARTIMVVSLSAYFAASATRFDLIKTGSQ
jgi:hypothetical protein